MTTDFNYNNKTIDSGGPIKPSGTDQPGDPRIRVDFYSDIKLIPNPYVGMIITVKIDETNQNKMTDYKVLSLKANTLGIANSVIDRVQKYSEYLGVNTGGSSSSGTGGTGLTSEQEERLNKIPEIETSINDINESLNTKANISDIPTKISKLENDSKFVTQTQLDNVVISAGGFTVKNLSTSEISEILSAIFVVPVESIVASTNHLSINVGETRQITYTIIPANATDKTVTYSSSDNSKVSVDQLGNIRALEEGDVLITITCSNGVSTDCQVVVSAVSEVVAVTGISLNKTNVNMHTGDTLTLKATISPANATNKSVKWESSAPTVASIDNNGLVTALSDGSATITCTSVSNASVSANCTIGITTIKSLTSVTNGLVHSYDLTALNGSSTAVEDLTGDVVLTMDGFSDVASAKTADGIVTKDNSRLKQEAVSPTVTNEYSIVFTVKGARAASQGLLKCNPNGNNNGFAVSYSNNATAKNLTPLCITHSGFLLDGAYSTRDAVNYETITVTADYNNKEIKLYSGSYLLSTKSFDGLGWTNKAWFNDGYWGGKDGLCYRNILMYNRILSGEEVATIASEVCPNRINTANSPMVTANNRILTHISCNSTLTEGVLPNLVAEHYPLNSVASTTSEGFLVSASGTTYIKQYFSPKVTYVVKLGTIPNSSNEKRIINGLSNIEEGTFYMYSYIKNSRFAVRDTSRWLVVEQAVTINNINVIMVETNVISRTTVVYFNNIQVGSLNNYIGIFSGLENTEIPIKDFIIYDGIFDEETRTAIYNELIGGGN